MAELKSLKEDSRSSQIRLIEEDDSDEVVEDILSDVPESPKPKPSKTKLTACLIN